tara:strand:+ start:407 stop:625 length:219 start_codon:yes stop_codon:yes gene_type:complete
MKTITLEVEGISSNQWSTFILELNIMKKAWKRYGVKVDLKTNSLKKIITQGTSNGKDINNTGAIVRRNSSKR